MFEFAKRFRNTVRICPFDNSMIIGGFGNITKGEIDIYNLDGNTQKDKYPEIGNTKSPCATKINWSACGRYILTSVLHERLKVDNNFQIFRANGTKVLPKAQAFSELYHVEWQPHEAGVLSKPNVDKLKKEEFKDQVTKPKRLFKFGQGGDNSAFQQMMRQQMASGAGSDKGPKKIDTNQYKELQAKQTAKA